MTIDGNAAVAAVGCVFSTFGYVFEVGVNYIGGNYILKNNCGIVVGNVNVAIIDYNKLNQPIALYGIPDEEADDFTKGYFDYDAMAPGEVIREEQALIAAVRSAAAADWAVPRVYEERRNRFFSLSDDQNCARIYKAVQTIL